MSIRKRCKHASGKKGSGKTRVWRQCTCAWGTDIYVDGVRTWKNLGHDEQAARIADAQLRLDVMQGKRVRRSVGTGFSDLAEDWYAEKAADPDHRAIITWAAVRRGIDPPTITFRGVVKQSRRRPEQSHTVTDLKKVINALKEPFASMAEFALLTGLRRGEILALTVQDVEDNGVSVRGNMNMVGEIGPTKTASGNRLVTFTPRTKQLVDARVKAVGAGRLWPVTMHAAGDAMREGMQAAGVYKKGKGWHTFRHAHMALLNESGVSLRDSAARLGHGANYAQSLAYGWASEQVDASAVDAAVKRHEKKK